MRRIPLEVAVSRAPGPEVAPLVPVAVAAFALLLGALLAAGSAVASAGEKPTVIMISLDGTRPADLVAERLPFLSEFADRGARADALLPSLPSNTFPNHVTLATGVAPWRHGIVDNRFVDPERGSFDKTGIPGWIQVEPLWSILERQGVVTAAFHWVGSEGPWPGGAGPRYWKPFSSRTPEAEKVDQILAWLDLPEEERPRLVTSWFHGADHAGHHHGPDSPEAAAALRSQDRQLARLARGLESRALWSSTTLLVVSDHGMMVPERKIDLDAALEAAGVRARVSGTGGFVGIQDDGEAADRAVEVARAAGLRAWRRERAPAEIPVGNARFAPVVAVAPRRAAVVYRGLQLKGFHGHPPDTPEMAALLVAGGRAVRPGTRLGTIRNVDVAPTVLALLGHDVPEWMDGRAIPGLVDGLAQRGGAVR